MGNATRSHYQTVADSNLRLVSHCEVRDSALYDQYVPYADCIDPKNRVTNPLDHDDDYEPWIVPLDDGFQLLAKNPGIWVKENFLTKEETEGLLEIVKKYDEEGVMVPCVDDAARDSQSTRNKDCFSLSHDLVCGRTSDYETCTRAPASEEGAMVEKIIQKAKNTLSVDLPVYEFIGFAVARGDTPPQLLHEDGMDIVTFVIYLSDGGGATTFPAVDVAVTPKKGSASMWLNFHKDGSTNTNAFHGVGAQAPGIGERIVGLVEFKIPSPDGGLLYPADGIHLIDVEPRKLSSVLPNTE